MEKLKVSLTLLVISGLFIYGLYLLEINREMKDKERLKFIKERSGYSRGLITSFHSYKGRTLTVKYKVDNNEYEYNNGWDQNTQRLGEGDSITVRYSIERPDLAITELEEEYND